MTFSIRKRLTFQQKLSCTQLYKYVHQAFFLCISSKTQVPKKIQVFHKTQLRIESAKLRWILPKTQVSAICKLELLLEMGTFGAKIVLNKQIQVSSKRKSGQLRKNSGRPEKTQVQSPKKLRSKVQKLRFPNFSIFNEIQKSA